ncbi:MAG: PEP-CTERM sorting domain-containing protein [Singulisphaera sp.]
MYFKFRRPCARQFAITFLAAATALTSISPAHAVPIVLNFDELPSTAAFAAGTSIPLAAQLSTHYQPSYGVTFSSVQPYVPVVPLNDTAPSPPNGIGMSDAAGLVSYSTFINAIFTMPGNPFAPAVTDFVSVQGDLFATNLDGILTLTAYDRFGNVIAVDQQHESAGVVLSVSVPGIHGVQIIGDGSTAFDNFTFNATQLIPEPGSLVLAGMAVVAALVAAHRRRANL